MVGQEFDAGRGPAGLDLGSSLDLGEERRHVRRRIGSGEVFRKLEERDDRTMTFRRGLALGDRVAAHAELALEGGRQPGHQRFLACDAGERTGHPHRASDLRAREEPLAADVEWDPSGPERSLDRGELGVRSHEDRDGSMCGPRPPERPDRLRHPGQFGLVGREASDLGLGPWRDGRHEAFRWPRRDSGKSLVSCHPASSEDAIGEREDLGRRAVVGLQPHDARARVALREADQVVARGAGERVDRLVLVADDSQVLAAAEPGVEEGRLERVGVLVFVHGEPAISVADLGGDRGVGLDQPDRQFEHVLEIDPAGARLGGLVPAVETGHQVRWQRCVAVVGDRPHLVVVRADPTRLRPFDLAGEVADLEEPVAARETGGQRGEDRHLRFEDRRRVATVDARPEMAKLAKGRSMERRSRHARVPERRQPATHLAGGLVGERDDQHVARPDDVRRERVGDPSRDDPGLATPRAGEDAQRAGRHPDCLALGRIEVGKQGVRVAVRHVVIVAGSASRSVISRWGSRGVGGPVIDA